MLFFKVGLLIQVIQSRGQREVGYLVNHNAQPAQFIVNVTCQRHMSVTWFGFGEASSHDGPRIEGRPGSEGGRGGEREVREARSDPRAGLLGREVTITQKRVCENLQVRAGHRTPQLLHIICEDRRGDIIRITRVSRIRAESVKVWQACFRLLLLRQF